MSKITLNTFTKTRRWNDGTIRYASSEKDMNRDRVRDRVRFKDSSQANSSLSVCISKSYKNCTIVVSFIQRLKILSTHTVLKRISAHLAIVTEPPA